MLHDRLAEAGVSEDWTSGANKEHMFCDQQTNQRQMVNELILLLFYLIVCEIRLLLI